MNTESINSPTVQAKANSDPLKELEKLGELKQKGLISEEEFRDLKADLLRKVREAQQKDRPNLTFPKPGISLNDLVHHIHQNAAMRELFLTNSIGCYLNRIYNSEWRR
jgi:TPP-dependent pyruvate/acetoin dehydrogenase alpha subunit